MIYHYLNPYLFLFTELSLNLLCTTVLIIDNSQRVQRIPKIFMNFLRPVVKIFNQYSIITCKFHI